MGDEDVLTEARGVTPGDRWELLKQTSPSGKSLFRCRSCGEVALYPEKWCWEAPQEAVRNSRGEIVFQPRRLPREDCAYWQPVKIYRYVLQQEDEDGWAHILLDSSGLFTAVSAYGNYTYFWQHHDQPDFRLFFLGGYRDWDYFAQKFQARKVYDANATLKEIKYRILWYRKRGVWERSRAKEEWDLLERHQNLQSVVDWQCWLESTRLFGAVDLYRDTYPENVQNFCKKTLKRLSELLARDLRREGISFLL